MLGKLEVKTIDFVEKAKSTVKRSKPQIEHEHEHNTSIEQHLCTQYPCSLQVGDHGYEFRHACEIESTRMDVETGKKATPSGEAQTASIVAFAYFPASHTICVVVGHGHEVRATPLFRHLVMNEKNDKRDVLWMGGEEGGKEGARKVVVVPKKLLDMGKVELDTHPLKEAEIMHADPQSSSSPGSVEEARMPRRQAVVNSEREKGNHALLFSTFPISSSTFPISASLFE